MKQSGVSAESNRYSTNSVAKKLNTILFLLSIMCASRVYADYCPTPKDIINNKDGNVLSNGIVWRHNGDDIDLTTVKAGVVFVGATGASLSTLEEAQRKPTKTYKGFQNFYYFTCNYNKYTAIATHFLFTLEPVDEEIKYKIELPSELWVMTGANAGLYRSIGYSCVAPTLEVNECPFSPITSSKPKVEDGKVAAQS